MGGSCLDPALYVLTSRKILTSAVILLLCRFDLNGTKLIIINTYMYRCCSGLGIGCNCSVRKTNSVWRSSQARMSCLPKSVAVTSLITIILRLYRLQFYMNIEQNISQSAKCSEIQQPCTCTSSALLCAA